MVLAQEVELPEPEPPKEILSEDELMRVLRVDETGEARRKDALSDFPEVSVYTGWNFRKDKVITGLGIELFHSQNRPRDYKWKFQLMLGDDIAGLSVGRILVPVINFEVGPGYDFINKAWIVKLSWYKF